jgi:hypothetical protein
LPEVLPLFGRNNSSEIAQSDIALMAPRQWFAASRRTEQQYSFWSKTLMLRVWNDIIANFSIAGVQGINPSLLRLSKKVWIINNLKNHEVELISAVLFV